MLGQLGDKGGDWRQQEIATRTMAPVLKLVKGGNGQASHSTVWDADVLRRCTDNISSLNILHKKMHDKKSKMVNK